MKTAVQFGAGNIGRGFIAQLYCESGLETAFVDVVPEVVQALNERRSYTIHIVGPDAEDVPVHNVHAVHGNDQAAVAEAVATSQIVSTAVGAGVLKHIAPNLAAGLALRHERDGGPLNILICENLHDAKDVLQDLIAEHLPPDSRDAILAKTGFVQAVVSRMVPLQDRDPHDPLAIRVEAYKRLPVDGQAVKGDLPPIVGVEPVPNFLAHVERKLYTHNCAHATLGYLGWLQGHEYGWQALDDPGIRAILNQVMQETGEALIRKHGFERAEHEAHVADLLRRFTNRDLGDTCFRLARDPVRKLAPDDRLTGAARLCESQGIEPQALPRVIAAVFRFRPPGEPSATEIHVSITQAGLETTLQKYTGIDPSSRLGMAVCDAYERLSGR
jgi:mannitol-1-phosphate 5-dehydrogenase